MAINSPRMTKNRKKLRQVVFFANLQIGYAYPMLTLCLPYVGSMNLPVDDHQVKQGKIAIGLHVLNGKSMRPVVADCVFW